MTGVRLVCLDCECFDCECFDCELRFCGYIRALLLFALRPHLGHHFTMTLVDGDVVRVIVEGLHRLLCGRGTWGFVGCLGGGLWVLFLQTGLSGLPMGSGGGACGRWSHLQLTDRYVVGPCRDCAS